VPYDKSELRDIMNGLNASLSDDLCVASEHVFQINDIKHAVSKLKHVKVDVSSGLTSDHVVHAGDEFISHIVLLFTLFDVPALSLTAFFQVRLGLYQLPIPLCKCV